MSQTSLFSRFWIGFRRLLELIRFSHTLFALPFALLAAVLAWREPGTVFRLRDLVGIVLCMASARAAAMAFNRLLDRKFDALNPRTAGRHLPAGLLSVSTVAAFAVISAAGFIACTLLFLPNRWPLYLSVPVLAVLLGYSYSKRWLVWCHYWLATALMLSPIAVWIAIRGEVGLPSLLLAAVIFFWVGGFDIIYACQDVEFDRQAHLSSVPARFGVKAALRIALVSHVLTVVCLWGLWHAAELGPLFLAGVVGVGGLLAYEHWLVRPDDLTRVNVAFFNVNAMISVGLFVVCLADLYIARLFP